VIKFLFCPTEDEDSIKRYEKNINDWEELVSKDLIKNKNSFFIKNILEYITKKKFINEKFCPIYDLIINSCMEEDFLYVIYPIQNFSSLCQIFSYARNFHSFNSTTRQNFYEIIRHRSKMFIDRISNFDVISTLTLLETYNQLYQEIILSKDKFDLSFLKEFKSLYEEITQKFIKFINNSISVGYDNDDFTIHRLHRVVSILKFRHEKIPNTHDFDKQIIKNTIKYFLFLFEQNNKFIAENQVKIDEEMKGDNNNNYNKFSEIAVKKPFKYQTTIERHYGRTNIIYLNNILYFYFNHIIIEADDTIERLGQEILIQLNDLDIIKYFVYSKYIYEYTNYICKFIFSNPKSSIYNRLTKTLINLLIYSSTDSLKPILSYYKHLKSINKKLISFSIFNNMIYKGYQYRTINELAVIGSEYVEFFINNNVIINEKDTKCLIENFLEKTIPKLNKIDPKDQKSLNSLITLNYYFKNNAYKKDLNKLLKKLLTNTEISILIFLYENSKIGSSEINKFKTYKERKSQLKNYNLRMDALSDFTNNYQIFKNEENLKNDKENMKLIIDKIKKNNSLILENNTKQEFMLSKYFLIEKRRLILKTELSKSVDHAKKIQDLFDWFEVRYLNNFI